MKPTTDLHSVLELSMEILPPCHETLAFPLYTEVLWYVSNTASSLCMQLCEYNFKLSWHMIGCVSMKWTSNFWRPTMAPWIGTDRSLKMHFILAKLIALTLLWDTECECCRHQCITALQLSTNIRIPHISGRSTARVPQHQLSGSALDLFNAISVPIHCAVQVSIRV